MGTVGRGGWIFWVERFVLEWEEVRRGGVIGIREVGKYKIC